MEKSSGSELYLFGDNEEFYVGFIRPQKNMGWGYQMVTLTQLLGINTLNFDKPSKDLKWFINQAGLS